MYNSIIQTFHGQRTPTVLIQTPPKGPAQTKHSLAEVEVFILSLCFPSKKNVCDCCIQVLKSDQNLKQQPKYESKAVQNNLLTSHRLAGAAQ